MKLPALLYPAAALALAGGVALTALPALAQDAQRPFAGPAFRAESDSPGLHRPGFRGPQGRGNLQRFADLPGFACSEDAAARIAAAAAYAATRLDLTDEQAEYLATLEDSALEAQAVLCAPAADDATGETADLPGLFGRLAALQAETRARADALDLVVPALEAFYSSLTDAQRETLFSAPRPQPHHLIHDAHATAPDADADSEPEAEVETEVETPAG